MTADHICPKCDGYTGGLTFGDCPECKGTGWIKDPARPPEPHLWKSVFLSSGVNWYCARPGCLAVKGAFDAMGPCLGVNASTEPTNG